MGRGYLAVLTIFTILEFFIAVIATHFGCQATRAQANAVSTSASSWAPEGGCLLGRLSASRPSLLPPGEQPRRLGSIELHSYKRREPKEVFARKWYYFPRGHRGAPAPMDPLRWEPWCRAGEGPGLRGPVGVLHTVE